MGRLTNKVALISGVARGQGRAHAQRLVSEGVSIIGFDGLCTYDTVPYPQATQEDLDETVRLIEEAGGRDHPRRAGPRGPGQIGRVIRAGRARGGPVDIVVAKPRIE